MRRNSAPSISLLTLAIVLFGSVQFAHAGGLLSRMLAGKKGVCKPAPKLRLFQRCPTDPCCPPPSSYCPPCISGADCPKQLLGMISDVDENGETHCVFRVFLTENCSSLLIQMVNLPCSVNQASCHNGQCGENGGEGLEGPFIEIRALPPLPGPGPGPIPTPAPANPGTNGVVVDTNASGLSGGLPPVHEGFTRQVIGVQANPTLAGYFEHDNGLGGKKYYALYRLSFVRGNETREAGIGFEVSSVPNGGTMLPGKWANVFNKTHRVDETDPADPNKVVWTYVVHENR